MARRRTWKAIQASELVTIGELASLSGTRYSTLKFYTEEGMLLFEQAEPGLTRRYPRIASLERITVIRELRRLGRTIPEVKAILTG